MELSFILLKQLIIMFIFMAIGFILYKKKMITDEGSKTLSNLLLYIILPSVIINSYCVERTPEKMKGFIYSLLISLAALILAMAISAVFFKKRKVENFGVAFSNAGFMGIPIVTAVLGSEAVFYISSFVALLNIFQWTYGVCVMTDSLESIKLKKLTRNPILIAMVIGMFFFLTQIPVPQVVGKAISSLAALNAPIAMIIIGIFLAQTDLQTIFVGGALYLSSAVRLLVIPIATMLLLWMFPIDITIKLAILIAASAPVGSNVAVFAQIHGLDYKQASKIVCLSTILSVISMPIVVGIANTLW